MQVMIESDEESKKDKGNYAAKICFPASHIKTYEYLQASVLPFLETNINRKYGVFIIADIFSPFLANFIPSLF